LIYLGILPESTQVIAKIFFQAMILRRC